MAGRTRLTAFLQRLAGYCLTGDTSEQALFIFHGGGANGKSTLVNALIEALGGYAKASDVEVILSQKQRAHPTERAALKGARLVSMSEPDRGRRIAEGLVKQLTGGEALEVRRMREDPWTFTPEFKLLLATNHKPEVRGTDYAIWRRIHLVPFDVRIGPEAQDKNLSAKLREELPGILAWAVKGCLAWQREGLNPPAEVREATEAYRAEMDVLEAFIGECCTEEKHTKAKAGDLYRAYCEWCERSGERAETQRSFGMRLTERGLERYTNNGMWYRGIGLLVPSTEGTEGTEPDFDIKAKKNAFAKINTKVGSVGSVGSVGTLGNVTCSTCRWLTPAGGCIMGQTTRDKAHDCASWERRMLSDDG
jgi:putative DNA primase/helicase